MNDSLLFGMLAGGVVVLVVGILILSHYQDKKRRAALAEEAAGLGLAFFPERDRDLGEKYQFLNVLRRGDNPYAEGRIEGRFEGEEVMTFDFHYETTSKDSEGRETTHHHWHHVSLIHLPKSFPELVIGPETLLTRLAKNFGYASIDFESHEFSREFLVRSPDKKFAYDICHARMMEYLLANRGFAVEIEGSVYALIEDEKRRPGTLAADLNRLLTLRRLMPEYLFST